MTRTTFSNEQCAHVWAHQTQDYGRGSHGSVYFEGGAFYSYGRHFLVGFIIDGVALLTTETYSTSTGKHKSYAWRAVFQPTFFVPNLTSIRGALVNIKPIVESRAKGRPAISSYDRDAIRDYLTANASRLEEAAGLFIGSLIGLTAQQVKKLLANGVKAANRAVAKRAAIARKERAELARTVADLDEAKFALYRESSNGVPRGSYGIEGAKHFATELFRLQRDGKAEGLSTKRLARLAARVKEQRALVKRIEADQAGAVAAQLTTDYQAFKAKWDAAKTDTERYELGRHVNYSFRNRYGAGTPEILFFDEVIHFCQRERDRLIVEQQRADREKWQAGGSNYFRGKDENGGAYIRKNGDQLQTSLGAEVPWSHAVKAFRFIKLCREKGEGFQSNGRSLRVGHFVVDRIEPNGDFKAGCHKFSWAEIERLARKEGVFDVAPSDEAVEEKTAA